jgi:hypothetical protein
MARQARPKRVREAPDVELVVCDPAADLASEPEAEPAPAPDEP